LAAILKSIVLALHFSRTQHVMFTHMINCYLYFNTCVVASIVYWHAE